MKSLHFLCPLSCSFNKIFFCSFVFEEQIYEIFVIIKNKVSHIYVGFHYLFFIRSTSEQLQHNVLLLFSSTKYVMFECTVITMYIVYNMLQLWLQQSFQGSHTKYIDITKLWKIKIKKATNNNKMSRQKVENCFITDKRY